jgi:NitT/TauT family transport system substrate-binding protein
VDKIRIGAAHRGAGIAPLFAAIEGGYLRAQGLDAELVYLPGHPATLDALSAGEVDFINSVGPEVILANLKGGDAVIIASAISRSAQQVSARPGITRREDLRGKRWGVIARNDADECSIVMAFERWGWELARDAEIVVVGLDGARLDLLLDPRRVDVAIMHAPEPFQAAKRGWTLVEDLGRLDVAFPAGELSRHSCSGLPQSRRSRGATCAPTVRPSIGFAPIASSAFRFCANIPGSQTRQSSPRRGCCLRG